MPVLALVLPTDTFSQWSSKTNAVINAVNNESINQIINIINPLNNQDILVYNSSDGFFENTGIDALVNEIISNLATIPTDVLLPYYYANCGRQIF